MPFGGLLTVSLIGAGAGIGGALINKGGSSTSPTLDPQYSPLQSKLLSLVQSRLETNGLPKGFEEAGVGAINNTADVAKRASDQSLVRRGLATSPVAATVDAQNTRARVGQVGQFRAGLPLIAQQLQTQDLGLANDVVRQGRGTTTETSSGGGAAGAATNLASMLGYLYKKNAFGNSGGGAGDGGIAIPGGEFDPGTVYG